MFEGETRIVEEPSRSEFFPSFPLNFSTTSFYFQENIKRDEKKHEKEAEEKKQQEVMKEPPPAKTAAPKTVDMFADDDDAIEVSPIFRSDPFQYSLFSNSLKK